MLQLTPDNLSLDVLLVREHHGPELEQYLKILFQPRAIPAIIKASIRPQDQNWKTSPNLTGYILSAQKKSREQEYILCLGRQRQVNK